MVNSEPGPWFYAAFDQLPSQPTEDSMVSSEHVVRSEVDEAIRPLTEDEDDA